MRYQATAAMTDLNAFERSSDTYIQEDVPSLDRLPVSARILQSISIRSAELTPEDPTKVDASRVRANGDHDDDRA